MRHFPFHLALALSLLAACSDGEKRSGTGAAVTDPGVLPPTEPGGTGTASTLVFEALPMAQLYTQETADASCLNFTVTATDAAGPVADVGVVFSVESKKVMKDKGKFSVEGGVTGPDGKLTASYCSGAEEGTVVLYGKTKTTQANTGEITIVKKPVYEFSYSHADILEIASSDDPEKSESVLALNTIDSGPNDCTFIYFKLTKSGAPISGQTLKFMTQVDFPKGAKLAKRADAGLTEIETITGKKRAVYESVSSSMGEFAIPVCSGVSLGSMLVSGTFINPEENKAMTVKSPVIRITSGLTNYINFSMRFDPINGRTLRAFYNTNSDHQLPVQIDLGDRNDGQAINEYPVIVQSEVGRYTLPTAGVIDPKTQKVPLTLQALHLVDNYAYPILSFRDGAPTTSIYPLAQTRCQPQELASWVRTKNSGTPLKYSELKKNWQSTFVYAVRGQEHFRDANGNGRYDAGGTGFWDKNQNGIYDAGDVVTFPVGGTFDPTSEWFIDMPTPFVDVNDNNVYDENIDILMGDEYLPPNGKRDSDALIWKKEIFPISMGPSSFSMQTPIIEADMSGNVVEPNYLYETGANFYNKRFVLGTRGAATGFTSAAIGTTRLWPRPTDPDFVDDDGFGTQSDRSYTTEGIYRYMVYLQDLCGNLLPGGTHIKYNINDIYPPEYGPRKISVFFQEGSDDYYLEPSRKLYANAGGNEAKINFNVIDHPSAPKGYPSLANLHVSACQNVCKGPTATPGVACDAYTADLELVLTDPDLDQHASTKILWTRVSVPATKTCTCAATTPPMVIRSGECQCFDPRKVYDGGTTSCVDP